jgi:hypothetical protein
MRRLLIVAALAALLAVPAAGASSETAATFATRILREEITGQWAKQWTELHPAHQRLITQRQYVVCSRGMRTDFGSGRETFHILDVRDDPLHVQFIPQHTAKLVTISFQEPGRPSLTYRVHAVRLKARWAWILGDRFLSQLARGRCLDGTPLPRR